VRRRVRTDNFVTLMTGMPITVHSIDGMHTVFTETVENGSIQRQLITPPTSVNITATYERNAADAISPRVATTAKPAAGRESPATRTRRSPGWTYVASIAISVIIALVSLWPRGGPRGGLRENRVPPLEQALNTAVRLTEFQHVIRRGLADV
jgi:hypothetical protein